MLTTILAVDDEPVLLDAVRRSLNGEGFSVLTAESGEAALGIYERAGGGLAATGLYDAGVERVGGGSGKSGEHRRFPLFFSQPRGKSWIKWWSGHCE